MAKKTPAKIGSITSGQRKALIRAFTLAVENSNGMFAVQVENWVKALRKAAPVILSKNPQEVVKAIKAYEENPPVKPPSKVILECPFIGKPFTLVLSAAKSVRCKLVRIDYQRDFEAVRVKIMKSYGGIPSANCLHAFKVRYPNALGPIGLAVATDVPTKQGCRQFLAIREDGSEYCREFYSNVSFGSEWLWLVFA